jgi:ABC-type multidrug transport system ATPase subunit
VDRYVDSPTALHDILGYCPQTNTFDGALTVKQQVTLFARLVGVESASLESYVDSTITRFGLGMFVNAQAQNLSGGNMRKLSLAIAMIGRPKIVFVDEASAGVDPASRRIMWKAIRHEG